jgi:hypothetical protein
MKTIPPAHAEHQLTAVADRFDQYHAQIDRVENALFIGKWKVSVTQGYRYLRNIGNGWLSTDGSAENPRSSEIGTAPWFMHNSYSSAGGKKEAFYE